MARLIDANATIEVLRANFQQGSWYGCEEPGYQIAEETIEEMPTITTAPSGDPLTLEELREMDGKPVWVEFIGHPDGTPIKPLWMLVNCRENRLVTDVEYVDWNDGAWLAYPYPLPHIDREAWEPCESCNTCENCRNKDDYNPYEGMLGLCAQCYKKSEFDPFKFCKECGRPLTEEAWAELEKRLRG